MELKVKLTDGAKLPRHSRPGDAGMDLANVGRSFQIDPHETVMVHTGVRAAIPEGFYGEVVPRSGISTKRGLAPINSPGTIDANYRGEILIPLHNFSEKVQVVDEGERVAQIIIKRHETVVCIETDELDETERGESGFGSSGEGAL